MEIIDLTTIPVPEKHSIIFDKIRTLEKGQKLCLKSEQDLIILQSHIVEEIGDKFGWEHRSVDGELFELIVEKL